MDKNKSESIGRPKGRKETRAKYILSFINIDNGKFEPVDNFATIDDISNYLATKNIHYKKQTLQFIRNGNVKNEFIKIEYI